MNSHKIPKLDLGAAMKRAKHYAETIGVSPPARLICEDGTPAEELNAFCREYGASLDWIFLGDIRQMILNSHERNNAKASVPNPAFDMYREWKAARAEWMRRSDTDDWNSPHMVELERRQDAVEVAARQKVPETIPQAALVALLVWDNERPDARTGTPDYYAQLEHPWVQTLLRLREWAERILEK